MLNAIYERDFLGFSYGFRPGRRAHVALDALAIGIRFRKISWILDADIRGYFDKLQHTWLVRLVEHRVGDRRLIRLIQKGLKAGMMEQGQWAETEEGSPQGSGDHSSYTKGDFQFERVVKDWQTRFPVLDLRLKK